MIWLIGQVESDLDHLRFLFGWADGRTGTSGTARAGQCSRREGGVHGTARRKRKRKTRRSRSTVDSRASQGSNDVLKSREGFFGRSETNRDQPGAPALRRCGLARAGCWIFSRACSRRIVISVRHLSTDPATMNHRSTLSNAGLGALAGGVGAMWLFSYPTHREHWRETGYLSAEAAINSFLDVEALKYSLRRQRPFQGDGSGPFFSGGTSFPSEHAAVAWSVAGIVAHEYPGFLPKLLAYGLATFVDTYRVRGRQHFNSDVFVGGLMGQMIAQDIYTRRHDPELGGGEWQSFSAIARAWESSGPQNLGTPYVPLDSWIYNALDRLAGLGYIDSAFSRHASVDTTRMSAPTSGSRSRRVSMRTKIQKRDD